MGTSTSILSFLKEIYRIWITERPTQFAAALAYSAIFSFLPVIYIAFTLADILVDKLSMAEQFYVEISSLLGEEGVLVLQDRVTALAERTTGGTTLTVLIGVVALLLSASLMFSQLQHILNTIWRVPPPSREVTRAYIRNRLLAFAMVLGVSLLLILVAVIDFLISVFHSYVDFHSPVPIASFLVFTGLAALSFALLYKVLPNARVAWRDVWLGAVVTALLVTTAIYLVGLFLGASKFSSALEAAGTVAVLLTAFYFLGQIFVFGAVFIRVYASMYGSHILPREDQRPPSDASPGERDHNEPSSESANKEKE